MAGQIEALRDRERLANLGAEDIGERTLRRTRSLFELLHTVAASANRAHDIRAALAGFIEAMGLYAGWSVGHVWLPDRIEKDRLVPGGTWWVDAPGRYDAFQEHTAGLTFPGDRACPARSGRAAGRSG